MKRTWLLLAVAVLAGAVAARAGTLGYWRFEGKAGEDADGKKVVSAANARAMTGEGHKSKGSKAQLAYSDDVPDKVIYDPVARRYADNATSMRFASFQEKTDVGNVFSYNDYVEVPDSPQSRPAAFTIEGFIKTAGENRKWTTIVAKTRSWGPVWGLDTEELHPGALLKLRMKLQVKGRKIVQYRTAKSPDLKEKGWHHFAYTYDPRSGEMKLYWDYKLAETFTIDDATKRELHYDPPKRDKLYPMFIGGLPGKKGGWNGWLDELRYSDAPLEPEQFLRAVPKRLPTAPKFEAVAPGAAPAAGKAVGPGKVVGYWRFEAAKGSFADKKKVASEVNEDTMTGTGVRSAGGQGELFYIDEVPGKYVHDPLSGLNRQNTTSLKFASYAVEGDDGKAKPYCDYVNVPDSAAARPEAFTLEGFLKRDGKVPKWSGVIGKRAAFAFVWGLDTEDWHPGGLMKLRILLTTANKRLRQFRNADSPTIKDDGWHHFALTYDPKAGEAKLYWDHKLAVTYAIEEEKHRPLAYPKGEHAMVIGGRPGKRGWDGWMDEIRLTSGVLPPEKFLRASAEPVK
jgi:hypothetical protein